MTKNKTAIVVMMLVCMFSIKALALDVEINNKLNELTAKSSILMDGTNGTVIFEKNSKDKLPIASITKVVAMIIVMDEINNNKLSMDDIITTSAHAASMGGSQVYLKEGEKFTTKDMLKAVAIHSANDCTVALAEKISGSENAFVNRMNEKAKLIGMKDTHFLDCTGLTDDGHYSTAYDIAVMAKEVVTNYPKILEFSSIWKDVFRDGKFSLYNTNKLVNKYDGLDGLKTGFTNKAGYCLVATAKRNDIRLISVVLGTKSNSVRFSETRTLLDYGFSNLENYNVSKKGDFVEKINIKKGIKKQVDVVHKDDINLTIMKKDRNNVQKNIRMFDNIVAPIEKGKKLGTIEYKVCDNVVLHKDIVAKEDVPKASFIRLFFRAILNWLGIE